MQYAIQYNTCKTCSQKLYEVRVGLTMEDGVEPGAQVELSDESSDDSDGDNDGVDGGQMERRSTLRWLLKVVDGRHLALAESATVCAELLPAGARVVCPSHLFLPLPFTTLVPPIPELCSYHYIIIHSISGHVTSHHSES